MDQAWNEDFPFDPNWTSEQFSVAVQYLIKRVIGEIYSPQQITVENFVRKLLETRFIPLYHNSSAVNLLKGIKTTNDPHLVRGTLNTLNTLSFVNIKWVTHTQSSVNVVSLVI
jgi:hypothetical protein